MPFDTPRLFMPTGGRGESIPRVGGGDDGSGGRLLTDVAGRPSPSGGGNGSGSCEVEPVFDGDTVSSQPRVCRTNAAVGGA